jgi:hypothetical protein
LNSAVESFEQFLKTNFPDFDNESKRIKAFLEFLQKNSQPDSNWNLPTSRNQEIISDFETSGFRIETWIYGYEENEAKYDISEILPAEEKDTSIYHELGDIDFDNLVEEGIMPISNIDSAEIARQETEMEERIRNSVRFNSNGQYLYALAKYTLEDTTIQNYVEVKILVTDISPAIIASGLLSQEIDFDNPFLKRILVMEFYYWIMKWDINRKEKK